MCGHVCFLRLLWNSIYPDFQDIRSPRPITVFPRTIGQLRIALVLLSVDKAGRKPRSESVIYINHGYIGRAGVEHPKKSSNAAE